MTNVLIVEDEQAIRRFLRTALEGDGMRVYEAETLQRGLLEAATRKPDLIILDLACPMVMGLSLSCDLRQWSAVPVIVLSARSEESDKIAALDAGADDYLSKPFGIGELQARLRVALRRHSATAAPDPLVKFSDVTVDLAARVIHRGEEEVHLTPIQFRLLAVLLNNAGKCSPSASYSIRCGGQTRSNTVTICVFIWTSATKTGTGSRSPPPFHY
ncbi:response regulator [Escherichia coli]